VDLSRCERHDCRAGVCDVAQESPLFTCASCGDLIVRSAADGYCIDCIALTLAAPSLIELS